jgi:hypothetical protein
MLGDTAHERRYAAIANAAHNLLISIDVLPESGVIRTVARPRHFSIDRSTLILLH